MSEEIRDGILFVTSKLSDPYRGANQYDATTGEVVPKEKEPEIKVTRYEVRLDPTVEVLSVDITDEKSSWKETVPSDENLHWFLRGVQAGASMFGGKHVNLPEIPRNSEPMPDKWYSLQLKCDLCEKSQVAFFLSKF